MSYEVERKYRIEDIGALTDRLRALGGEFGQPESQRDMYYAHPSRDFAHTDEALRIRRIGDEAFITYKGPKIDPASKTRLEIELPLMGGLNGASDHARLLEALGFRPVAEVSKRRRKADLTLDGRDFEIALDDVESVGTFVEIETAADEADLEEAKSCLGTLADKLALQDGERRSYLELLLLDRSDRAT
ncbi:MAG TPA: class IV adenylate cyclase [Pirellulales bacterium]|nr:class IV adenylate cyclase [Pirellulales bacterium]